MVADELRRQADEFIDLTVSLENRTRSERSGRSAHRNFDPERRQGATVSAGYDEDILEGPSAARHAGEPGAASIVRRCFSWAPSSAFELNVLRRVEPSVLE